MSGEGDAPVTPANRDSEARRGRGCFVWGCGTVLLVVVIAGGALGWVFWSTISELKENTSTVRVPVSEFQPAPGQVEAVAERAETFAETARGGESRIELAPDDLNALLRTGDPRLAEAVHVRSIEGDRAQLELSIPLEDVGFEGRYFNGEAVIGIQEERRELPVPVVIHELRTREGKELSAKLRSAMTSLLYLGIERALTAKPAEGESGEASPIQDLRRVLVERGRMQIENGRLIVDVAPQSGE